MPPKAKPFSSQFASSDEEPEIAETQESVKKPGRKASAGRGTTKSESAVCDDDDNDNKEEEPSNAPQKTTASRRGGRPKGSKNTTRTAISSKEKQPAKVSTIEANDKPKSTGKVRRGRPQSASKATNEAVEETDILLPDAPEEEEEGEEEEEVEGSGDDNGERGKEEDQETMLDLSTEVDKLDIVPRAGRKNKPSSKKSEESKSKPDESRKAKATEKDAPEVRDANAELEKLTLKYNELLALRSTKAELALNEFKENMKKKDIASEKLISALTSEVKIASELSTKSRELQGKLNQTTALLQEKEKQLVAQKAAYERLQRDNEHLTAKLSSGRPQGPGSGNNRGGNTAAFREVSSLKEELYGDLSGLIIRSIQDDNEGLIVYDCLQTGRNGTLHFKLSVSSAALSNRSDGYNSADSEITFTPLLDVHDKVLERVLPSYLKEEITFPREKASSFYLRLANSLQNSQVQP